MAKGVVTSSLLSETLSFEEYLHLTENILEEKIDRSGLYKADNTFRYTRSNLERMKKVLDKIELSQKLYNLLSELKEEWIWLVISEPWCGDASWGTPTLCMIASASDKIQFRILLRDTHPEVITHYQTAGSDSIPKLICLQKSDLKELGTWGPRPQVLHDQVLERLKDPTLDYRESVRAIHAWYEADMTKSTQEEILECIKTWKSK